MSAIIAVSPSLENKTSIIRKPRLGFLGVGWIGRDRLQALQESGSGDIAAIADSSPANLHEAAKLSPEATYFDRFEDLLELDLDGIVIATPSALHARQAIAALENGRAVFCQKPLARTKAETSAVIETAKKSNQLLGVDLSYRFLDGVQTIRRIIQDGGIGRVFAVDLVFHNAYGPDKEWFYDLKLSGGGCVIDLGIHLVDLAFWTLGAPRVEKVVSRLFRNGEPLCGKIDQVEDFASARIDLQSGASLQLSCSWKLQAGCEAVIGGSFYGTKGGLEFRNVNGSFYEFKAERFLGTKREVIASGTEDWGGRAAIHWLKKLSEGQRYDPEVEGLIDVSGTLDAIYGRA